MTEEQTLNLFDVGCLLNLHVGTWSGRKMLTESDMIKVGLDPTRLPKKIVNYGRKLLVPKEELSIITRIEANARHFLSEWSVPFGIAKCHFVPIKSLPNVEERLKGWQDDFNTAVTSFVKRFNDIKEVIKQREPEFWDKCLKTHYPNNPALLKERFSFNWFTFRIAGMDSIQESSVDDLIAKDTARQEKLVVERTRMKEEVEKFVGDYIGSMRTETVRFCDLVAARISGKPYGEEKKAKKLTGRSIHYFRKHIDRFRQMNIFGDEEVDKMLADLRHQYFGDIASAEDFEDANVKNGVTKVLAAIRKKAAIENDDSQEFIGTIKRKIVI